MAFDKHTLEDQRLRILQFLSKTSGGDLNENIIKRSLKELGHRPSADQLRTTLHWLKDQNLVTITKIMGLTIAKITETGNDVATGDTTVPNVAEPNSWETNE